MFEVLVKVCLVINNCIFCNILDFILLKLSIFYLLEIRLV